MFLMELPDIYAGNYSLLALIPLILVIPSLALIFLNQVPFGIELKGGMLLTLQLGGKIDPVSLENALTGLGMKDVSVRTYTNPAGDVAEIEIATDDRMLSADDAMSKFDNGMIEAGDLETSLARLRAEQATGTDVQAKITETEQKLEAKTTEVISFAQSVVDLSKSLAGEDVGQLTNTSDVKKIQKDVNAIYLSAKNKYKERIIGTTREVVEINSYSLEEVSPTLSKVFIQKVLGVAVISIILAVIGVFLIFRIPIPSIAVLTGASCDIIIALGAMAVFKVPLTLASFATLMMLTGLSLDTDMMLTIKTIKRTEDTPRKRAYGAFKTGFAMTTTIVMAFVLLLVLGMITHIPTYYQFGAVAVAGLIGDIITTWCLNAVLVLWYLEGKYAAFFRMVKR